MRLILCLLFGFFLNGAFAAPKFIAPDDSYPLIRRDKLPLDTQGIATLGDQLALLADGPISKNGRDLHNRARMLALSQRLSPAQPQARSILDSLSTGQSRPRADGRKVKEARDGIRRTAEWLVKLPAGEEGFLLGQLLLDIIAVQDKDHPLLEKHVSEEETTRWAGLIAPLEKFENKPKKPDPKNAAGDEATFKTESVLTWLPMINGPAAKGKKPPGVIRQIILVISKSGKENNGDDWERVRFKPRPPNKTKPGDTSFDARKTFKVVTSYFRSKRLTFPKDKSFTIDTGDPPYSAKNQGNISATMALLVDAALTGRPIRRNTFLFANLESDGTLTRPAEAWSILLALAAHKPPPGSRLIVPPGVTDDLQSLLVLEKAHFFVNYEILGARTFDEARPFFYEDGKIDPDLVSAMTDHQEVWDKAIQASSIQSFVSHQSVKGRLLEIVGKSSRHLSAAYLELQGRQRPAYFSQKMLAREILRCLEPLDDLVFHPKDTKPSYFRDMHDRIHKSLQVLERRIANDDRAMYIETVELVKKLKGLARKYNEDSREIVAFNIFKGERDAFTTRLKIAAGDLAPPKPKTQ